MRIPETAAADAEVRVVQWLVEVGQRVERCQGLLEVETDKAAMELEAPVTGVLKEVQVVSGDEVSAGQVIAIIEAEGNVADAAAQLATQETPNSTQDNTAVAKMPKGG